jgi:hypothetical protein
MAAATEARHCDAVFSDKTDAHYERESPLGALRYDEA